MPDDDTGGLDEVLAGRSFDIVLRGYDRVQVDRHLDWLEDQLLQARSEAARDRPSYAQLGERITRILELADQEAESIRRAALSATDDARAEASKIAERAQAEAGATTEQARANAERILAEARTQARQILDAAGREVQAMAEQRDKIKAELAALRERIAAVVSGVTSAAGSDATIDVDKPDEETVVIERGDVM